jgi:hypothetical protein
MNIIAMFETISGGIPDSGAKIEAFTNAFLHFGISQANTVKRYMMLMESQGYITHKGGAGINPIMWFRGEKAKAVPGKDFKNTKAEKTIDEMVIEKEADKFLNKF